MTNENKIDLDVVVPIYNEEGVLDELTRRLRETLENDKNIKRWTVLFINDGSTDSSLQHLYSLHQKDSRFKIINLSRNFGHQIAITAGIEHSQADALVIIDADLQDPPELISSFVIKYLEGFDVVYGQRAKREGESPFKLMTATLYYRLLKALVRIDIPVDTGDFRLISARVVSDLKKFGETHRFMRGLVSWTGYKQTGITYDRQERFCGESKYPLPKMLKFAWDGITSFSTAPLRLASWLGALTMSSGFAYIFYVLYKKCFDPSGLVPGWSSTMTAILILGGMQLLILGVIGEYLGRISDEVKRRPLYLVEKFYDD